MFRSSGGFANPEQLLYQARMQYVKGHVEPYDQPGLKWGEEPPKSAEVWTIQKPKHVLPRNASMRSPSMRRPSSAPASRRAASGQVAPYKSLMQYGKDQKGKAPRGLASVVGSAFAQHREDATRDIGKPRGRTTLKLAFANALGVKVLPVDRRLEFMKNEANRKRELAARVVAKEKKRREKIKKAAPIPAWKLVYQAGCWFWVDQNTGEATAAPPPERNDEEDTKTHNNHKIAQERQRRSQDERRALRRVNNYLNAVSSDDESIDSQDRLGVGSRFYDSKEFDDFMKILDAESTRRPHRPYSAPAATRRW